MLYERSASYVRSRPAIRPGYTVRVHERIQEGNKERVQVFEGLVIAVHKGATPTDATLTVRRIASNVGVEKVFLLHSPKIEKIEVKKVAKVRRAKLFFLRGRRGKAARLSERFTTAEEFAVAAAMEKEEVLGEEIVEENVEEEGGGSKAGESPEGDAGSEVGEEEKEKEKEKEEERGEERGEGEMSGKEGEERGGGENAGGEEQGREERKKEAQ